MNTSFINRPEYLFQPRLALKRLLRRPVSSTRPYLHQRTHWKSNIRFKNGEEIGRSLELMRIYDLSVSEVLWRLTDANEFVCDIGANIGYTASLLASRVGIRGKVLCFEPHPEIFYDLQHNVSLWQKSLGWRQIECKQLALSDQPGTATLHIPLGFDSNRGIATLFDSDGAGETQNRDIPVEVDTLDAVVASEGRVPTLLKIDVEGHEMSVLRGASKSLRQIRDVVYEEHAHHPAETTRLLQEHGFTTYRILKGLLGPVLADPSSKIVQNMALYWEPANYLATRDPQRAQERMMKKGWACLRG